MTDGDRPGLLSRLAEALAERGVASLRCDPRGCGSSGGEWAATGLFTRIDDARDMIAAMRSHSALDLRRTGIVGHGEGAVSTLAVAVGDPAIAALTLIGPPARPWSDVQREGAALRAADPDGDRRHPIVAAIDAATDALIERALRNEDALELDLGGGESVRIGLEGIEQAIHTPAVALATLLHRSCAVVHGSADAWSPPAESELLVDALHGIGNEAPRRLVNGAGHDLAEAPDALIGEVAADLAERLLPQDLPPVLVAIEGMG
jgi:pimeloyl-ACP methyl ester carboxylesterase